MQKLKYCKLILGLLSVLSLNISCSKGSDVPDEWWPDPDKPSTPDVTVTEKPRYIWIDAAANFPEFANSKENIRRDLTKAKDAGFTDIVVDVRPSEGDVLFNTTAVNQIKKLDYWSKSGYTFYERTETWDYLQAFIDIGHELGLKVNAAINTFVGGCKYSYGLGQQGMLFRDSSKKSWATTLNLKGGLCNAMDLTSVTDPNNDYGTKFLNPSNTEVQEFLLTILRDLAKYDVDGIFLDRCRYNDFQADFSEESKKAFENYLGKTVSDFPNSVIVPGTSYYPLPATLPVYFKDWMAFRAKTIHDFIVKARETVKVVNSKIKFGVYVGAWYSTYYEVGVNWASPKYMTSVYYPKWANTDYSKYGYADSLDFLLLGAYASTSSIYGSGEWTMQGFCTNAKKLLSGDVKFAGGPDVGNPTGWPGGGQGAAVTQSVDACINASDGYFLFDMVHVRDFNYWGAVKQGVDKYLNSIKK